MGENNRSATHSGRRVATHRRRLLHGDDCTHSQEFTQPAPPSLIDSLSPHHKITWKPFTVTVFFLALVFDEQRVYVLILYSLRCVTAIETTKTYLLTAIGASSLAGAGGDIIPPDFGSAPRTSAVPNSQLVGEGHPVGAPMHIAAGICPHVICIAHRLLKCCHEIRFESRKCVKMRFRAGHPAAGRSLQPFPKPLARFRERKICGKVK